MLHYTEQFDRVRLTPEPMRVSAAELAEAHKAAEPGFLETLRRVRQNILVVPDRPAAHRCRCSPSPGSHELRLRYRPMRRVGVCIPGGAAAYPSTLLMTVCPAQAAGVKEIAVVMPPTPTRRLQPRHAGDLPRTRRDRGVSHRRRPGRRGPGLRRRRVAAGRHDRRAGQHVRHAGQEARLRPGRDRLPRRAERDRRDGRRIGAARITSRPI